MLQTHLCAPSMQHSWYTVEVVDLVSLLVVYTTNHCHFRLTPPCTHGACDDLGQDERLSSVSMQKTTGWLCIIHRISARIAYCWWYGARLAIVVQTAFQQLMSFFGHSLLAELTLASFQRHCFGGWGESFPFLKWFPWWQLLWEPFPPICLTHHLGHSW